MTSTRGIQGAEVNSAKELGKLISEVSQNSPHTVVIMDCCHSGSGTRGELELDVAVRKAPSDKRKRPLDSFIVAPLKINSSLF